MPSVPTTSVDLASPTLVADPYPVLAAERSRHAVARHEVTGTWLTFDHAAAGAVLRERRLGRIWRDREPAALLEPFNLLHRHQMMENEPPEHTRMRRLVSGAFNRGHVERLRPRVRELAASLLAEVDPDGFDVVHDYAEPLPGAGDRRAARRAGRARAVAARLVAGDRAGCTRSTRRPPWSTPPWPPPRTSPRWCATWSPRGAAPREDLLSDLAATDLSADEVVATVVLLLNAGHEASVNVFGNGLVSMLRAGLRPAPTGAAVTVEEMLRHDSALQLFERTATETVEVAGVTLELGETIAALLGAAHRDPARLRRRRRLRPRPRPEPARRLRRRPALLPGRAAARMELESLGALLQTFPDLALAAEPESRGTFVLRGHRAVRVRG